MAIIAPVGISFYTFRTISYVVDVYKGKMPPVESYLQYLFYLSFFPCLVAGPVVRAKDFMPQLERTTDVTKAEIYGGFWLVMVGVVKKAVIADYLAQYSSIIFGSPETLQGYSGFELLMAGIGFTVQLYADFSGYSDMAIGLGAIMGFDLGVNFDHPFRSLNITEFWRRWHISLSFWLRDYVYIPLGGNRKGKIRQYVNLFLTMLIGGFWHGAGLCDMGCDSWCGAGGSQDVYAVAQANPRQLGSEAAFWSADIHHCDARVRFLPCRVGC